VITLFRRIRKKLIDSGSMTKYLLYAIGEILLVVIGILIALQVNTWNENRKIANEEQAILIRLLDDLKLAKADSKHFIVRENEDINRLKLILGNPQEQADYLLQPNRDQKFYAAAWDLSFDIPVILTYNDLQNAGGTGKIRDSGLRAKLSEMSLRILMLESLIGDRLSVHQNRIDNIVEYELNFVPLLAAQKKLDDIHPGTPNDYIELMQKPRVRNLLGIKLDLTILVLNVRKDLDLQLAEVIEMVQSEII